MTRVLIAEDSAVVAEILKRLFQTDPDFDVVGVARDGEEAVRLAAELKPDVITMDVIMPKMDGVAATERIMSETPMPIVIISSHVNDKEMRVTFRSLAAGALSVLEKPENVFSPEFEPRRKTFLDTIRAMAEVKVVRRRKSRSSAVAPDLTSSSALPRRGDYGLVAIGASTGGPQALHRVLAPLPAAFPLPIVIAQHISRGFTKGMVDWLSGVCALAVCLGEDGETMKPGTVYFAPDGKDIGVMAKAGGFCLTVGKEKPEGTLTPNVDALFRSVADAAGGRAICGLLTGMGSDGAKGLLAVREKGGWTFAESEESCVVYGMPAAAKILGAAREILHLDRAAAHLLALTGCQPADVA